MQVLVTIPDEIAAQVLASGKSPESYVQELIAERNPVAQPGIARKLADLESFFDEISAFSGKYPVPPDEAFSRESLYRDHD
jgi:hypothetical protein